MGIDPAELDGIRADRLNYLPDTCVNSRTLVSLACRVADGKREERIEGMPVFLRLRRWRITLPDAVDVKFGDILTVAGKGAYTVLMLTGPTSLSTATTVFCVAAGANLTNASVTFTDTSVSPQVPSPAINVILYQASHDAMLVPEAIKYRWAVAYPASFTHPSGHLLGEGDKINWSRLPGGSAAIETAPRPNLDPRLPLYVAYFQEIR